jgi:hypothetical protein
VYRPKREALRADEFLLDTSGIAIAIERALEARL